MELIDTYCLDGFLSQRATQSHWAKISTGQTAKVRLASFKRLYIAVRCINRQAPVQSELFKVCIAIISGARDVCAHISLTNIHFTSIYLYTENQ